MMQSGSTNETLNEIKTQLICREGIYRLVSQAEYGRPKASPYAPQTNAPNASSSSLPLVRMSFTKFISSNAKLHRPNHRINIDEVNPENGHLTTNESQFKLNGGNSNSSHSNTNQHPDSEDDLEDDIHHHHYHHHIGTSLLQDNQIQERICFNTGRELFVYIFNGLQPSDPSKLVDRKTYKSTSPTCHDFCTFVEQRISLLLIGFSHGQIQLIDPYRSEISKFYNQERLIDKSKVTCIRWLPRSKSNFLVSYSSGQMYLYKEDLPCFTATPTYQQFKTGDGFTIYTCKTRTTRNPIFRWSIGTTVNSPASSTWNASGAATQSAINEFAFSPCGQFLAVVSQDGFLRVFHYDQMDLIGRMRSYFGGLLCVGWSPDSKFLVTGGEDDLITVWSLQDKRVIARGQGHKSWVNSVTFDPYMTKTKDDQEDEDHEEDQENYESINHGHSDIDNDSVDGPHDIVIGSSTKRNDEFKLLTNYRIGSVGQDTQICLWDLTDDIIRQSTVIKSRSRSTISSTTTSGIGSSTTNNDHLSDHRTSKLLNNIIGTGTSHPLTINASSSSSIANNHNSQTSSTSIHHFHHHNFFNSLKKSGHKKGFSLSSRSFLDHGKNNKNQHPNAGSNKNLNDPNSTNRTLSVNDDSINNVNAVCDSSLLLGTILCPRLKEVPMLEPHICKKISHERLTSLLFRKDCLVVANHDGKIMIFARPNILNSNNLKVSSPNASMASDVNEIIAVGTTAVPNDDNETEQIGS